MKLTSRSMRLYVLAGVFCGLTAMAQSGGPAIAVWDADVRAAQAAGRWDDVLRLYKDQLGRTPERGDLWVKVADVENARGNVNAVRPILEEAVAKAPGDAELHARLSQQYAIANEPRKALAEIEEAVKITPDNADYLKARAQLANWLGLYRIAGDSYARLLALTPQGVGYGLMLARSRTWQGDLDAAAHAYRDYTRQCQTNEEALLEYARVEGWRGNISEALKLLDTYEQRFPTQPKPEKDRARMLAWANKPSQASKINDELLVKKPDDFELNVTRTIALDKGNRKEDAVKSLDTLKTLRPDSDEVGEITRHVRTPLRPDISLYGRYYHDEDNLEIWQEAARAGVSVSSTTRLGVGGELRQLSADPGSGLEHRDGSREADYQKVSVDVSQTLFPWLWVKAEGGIAEVDGEGSIFAYDLQLGARPVDSLTVTLEQSRDSLLISPRSASLGIRRDTTQLIGEWTPGLDYTVVGMMRYDDLSDGNKRWEGVLAPRRSVVRSQWLNLDLGVRGQVFGFDEDLNSGYYDPSTYEQYALTAMSYWKFTPESGLSLIGAAGYYKDDTMSRFDFGWSVDGELVVGVHSDWMGKLGGHYMQNLRESGGAYDAVAVDLSLVRRF